jgi:alkane 1-monooxygenase
VTKVLVYGQTSLGIRPEQVVAGEPGEKPEIPVVIVMASRDVQEWVYICYVGVKLLRRRWRSAKELLMELEASGTVRAESTEQWHDGKRFLWLIGLVVPSLAFAGVGLYSATGSVVSLWLGPIVILVVIPLIDLVAGLDRSNPPDDIIKDLENDRYYRWVTYLYLPIQYAGFLLVMWLIGGGGSWDLSLLDKVGLAVSIGSIGGIGINTAHELGHKKESHERWLAKVALAPVAYGHFFIEHNRGHHVRVATPLDPASSRLGESVYAFWPRTVAGSVASAWHLEARRFSRRDKHPFRLTNDVLNAWLMTAVLWGAVVVWLGPAILPFLVIQAVVGFSLLEIVNYMEHYGMLRQQVISNGRKRYERVAPSHSWNSNNIATNVLLYHLQRHSDHHANPTRRYQALRDFEQSPVLPTGYAGMIVLALFPPLWRRVMDRRVLAHYDGDVTRANVHPPKRERLLAAYPPPAGTIDSPANDAQAHRQGDGIVAARCPTCDYVYDVDSGDEREGFAAGTAWSQIPDDWCCPDCGVREKVDFVPLDRQAP